jgi:hypothetical protein
MSDPARPEIYETDHYDGSVDTPELYLAAVRSPLEKPTSDEELSLPAETITIDSLASTSNPLYQEISDAIDNNIKAFAGYEFVGETVPSNRKTRLRGVQQILGTFDSYTQFKDTPSTRLLKTADFTSSKRGFQGTSTTIVELTEGCLEEQLIIFSRLAEKNDPLAVTIAQLATRQKTDKDSPDGESDEPLLSTSDLDQLALDCIAAFKADEFKDLIESHIKRLRAESRKKPAK